MIDNISEQVERYGSSMNEIFVKEGISENDDCVLGIGTLSKTYRVKNTKNNVVYALQTIDIEQAIANKVSLEKLHAEVQLLCQLQHPNIVRYLANFSNSDSTKLYVVQELVSKDTLTLKDQIEKINPIENLIGWSKEILSALMYLAKANTQHFDLKPDNIKLIKANDEKVDNNVYTVKLIGLGLASLTTIEEAPCLNEQGVPMDTYWSYERARGLEYDARSDVWALGCLIGELVTGGLLSDKGGAIYLHTDADVHKRYAAFLEDIRSKCASDVFYDIICRMLEPLQANRMTASDLFERLDRPVEKVISPRKEKGLNGSPEKSMATNSSIKRNVSLKTLNNAECVKLLGYMGCPSSAVRACNIENGCSLQQVTGVADLESLGLQVDSHLNPSNESDVDWDVNALLSSFQKYQSEGVPLDIIQSLRATIEKESVTQEKLESDEAEMVNELKRKAETMTLQRKQAVALQQHRYKESERIKKLVRSDSDIVEAVKVWCNNPSAATAHFGNISDWNTSAVTNMARLFENKSSFNDDISNWDVSNVTNMSCMFCAASLFNQDLSNWNVGNVKVMSHMFSNAISFNHDLSKWDVSHVTDMSYLFNNAQSFNHDLSKWDVSHVTDMSYLFSNAGKFNQDISKWDVSHVTDMSYLFSNAGKFNQDISKWDVSHVTNMSCMFYSASSFNHPIGSWIVSNVTNMSSMFCTASSFNMNISKWDVGKVTDMSSIFCDASCFDQPLGTWTVCNVTDMRNMFYDAAEFDQDISKWDVGKVTNMNHMFCDAVKFNQPVGSWNVSHVVDMGAMFQNATLFDQSVGKWDVSAVTNMSHMFFNAISFNQDISGWDVSSVTTMQGMFQLASLFNCDIGNWSVSSSTDIGDMLKDASAFNQNINKWANTNTTNAPGEHQ